MQIGPDERFTLDENIPYEKIGSELKIFAAFQRKRGKVDVIKEHCATTYVINCDNNTFQLQVEESNHLSPEAKGAYFYFYLHSKCGKCNSSVDTTDIEFDLTNGSTFNFQVDRESYHLISKVGSYHATISHDQNMVMVSRLEVPEDGVLIDHERVVELPFFNLDVSDVDKAVNKIKMLILFS